MGISYYFLKAFHLPSTFCEKSYSTDVKFISPFVKLLNSHSVFMIRSTFSRLFPAYSTAAIGTKTMLTKQDSKYGEAPVAANCKNCAAVKIGTFAKMAALSEYFYCGTGLC